MQADHREISHIRYILAQTVLSELLLPSDTVTKNDMTWQFCLSVCLSNTFVTIVALVFSLFRIKHR